MLPVMMLEGSLRAEWTDNKFVNTRKLVKCLLTDFSVDALNGIDASYSVLFGKMIIAAAELDNLPPTKWEALNCHLWTVF